MSVFGGYKWMLMQSTCSKRRSETDLNLKVGDGNSREGDRMTKQPFDEINGQGICFLHKRAYVL